jgi:hypothetical protein
VPHPKHEEVRRRYEFQCGYCGISETDAGGELTVDHYNPVSSGGTDADENLVYACFRCNTNQGAILPLIRGEAPELRILHPLRDNVASHLFENPTTHHLEALTETGRHHIDALQLNRPALIQHRWRRQIQALQAAQLESQERRIEEQQRIIAMQVEYVAVLERLLLRFTDTP